MSWYGLGRTGVYRGDWEIASAGDSEIASAAQEPLSGAVIAWVGRDPILGTTPSQAGSAGRARALHHPRAEIQPTIRGLSRSESRPDHASAALNSSLSTVNQWESFSSSSEKGESHD
jgi:hypothetical protein